jgi:hypothetical protein
MKTGLWIVIGLTVTVFGTTWLGWRRWQRRLDELDVHDRDSQER